MMRTVKLTQKIYMFDEGLKDIEFNYNEGIESSNIPGLKLDYSGENPENGIIRITKDGEIGLVIHNDEYCAIKNYDSNEIILEKYNKTTCKMPILYGILTDSRDGQVYQTVRIGEQCWFAEDLRFECDGFQNVDTINGELIDGWDDNSAFCAPGGYDSRFNNRVKLYWRL
ncbi:MAG: hypothetical protein PHY00_03695 [Bacilli bacterium]|nr:hypothetical protein [Bacilli bacterium]